MVNVRRMNTILGSPLIDVYIISFGGVGTTFLIDFLSNYVNTNDSGDADGFKHIPLPPIQVKPNSRFIYVFGDPVIAAISLFRRGFHAKHSKKLQRFNWFQNLVKENEDISMYAKQGQDRLNFEEHFNNWFYYYRFYPTLFLRYDSIWNNVDSIINFLELPKYLIKHFPNKKERNSVIDSIDIETLNQLNSIYGDFRSNIQTLPDVIIRDSLENKNNRFKLYLSNQYIKAYFQIVIATLKNK